MSFYEILGKVIVVIILIIAGYVGITLLPEIFKIWFDKLPNFIQTALAIIILIILIILIGGIGILIFFSL